jgi:protein-S-isoprenylcysteine O-methyltransferase Ste14
MGPTHLTVLAAGYLTWAAFTVCMRYYFRKRRQASTAKDWLVRCAFFCTALHLLALALVAPPNLPLAWAALACYAAANVFYWWALAAHGRERPAFVFVPVAPAAFTDRGPYRLVRHPIYTAYLLGWLAGTLATGLPWLLLTVAVMGLLYYRAARLEEKSFLASPFARQYRAYQRRTGMFLPRSLAPARPPHQGRSGEAPTGENSGDQAGRAA